jgi:hypothetical protein
VSYTLDSESLTRHLVVDSVLSSTWPGVEASEQSSFNGETMQAVARRLGNTPMGSNSQKAKDVAA